MGEAGRIDNTLRESVLRKVAGDIILSPAPGPAMKKWRSLFELKQRDVASKMGIAQSVLSDYEKGKRRSPGIKFIKRFVESLVELDIANGAPHLHKFADIAQSLHQSIIDIKEFRSPVTLSEVAKAIDGVFLAHSDKGYREVHGYTVVDSLPAIRYMDSSEFIHLFGVNSMRLLVFTGVVSGRSPMVAVKVFPIKPRALAILGPKSARDVDWLAVELADSMGIPLLLSRLGSVNSLVNALRELNG